MKNATAKPSLTTLSPPDIANFVVAHRQPAFRSQQIRDWIFNKFCLDPMAMQNIPLTLRQAINNNFCGCSSTLVNQVKAGDNTEKLLIKLADDEHIEMVIIYTPQRRTFCISTQVGCPIQCRFCASGADGLIRNLTAAEIIEQLYHGIWQIGTTPDNIVFMGIGEGLLNFTQLSTALKIICSDTGLNISPRRITISTSGYIPGIYKLAQLGLPLNLAVSLHAPNDDIRAKLIPKKNSYPVDKIIAACRDYHNTTGRMITLEYTLIADINDSDSAAKQLAAIAKNNRFKVNLIPYNPVKNLNFRRPPLARLQAFATILHRYGVQATMRIEKGTAVNAACGQLRAEAPE